MKAHICYFVGAGFVPDVHYYYGHYMISPWIDIYMVVQR